MKDKIQILLSMIVCIMLSLTVSAQTFDFNPGGASTDNPGGTNVFGVNCSDGFLEFTTTVNVAGFNCPSGDVLNTLVGDGINVSVVAVDITHTFDGDIEIALISPAGTALDLTSDNGGSGDNFTGTNFVDGGTPITSGAAPFTGDFQPEGGTFAATFAGDDANGDWTMQVCDDAGGDVGTVNTATISFEANTLACPITCTLTCAPNQLINLEAGECEELVLFDAAVLGGDPLCMTSPGFGISGFQNGLGPNDAGTSITVTAQGFVDVSGAPASILTSCGAGNIDAGDACYNMTIPIGGNLSVDWDYSTMDGSIFDEAYVILNGVVIEVTANLFGGTESGTYTTNVTPGTTLSLCQDEDGVINGPSETVWSNIQVGPDPGYVIEQTTGPESGTYQGPGVYVITYTATNNQDLTDVLTCSTTITINEYSGPVLTALTCNDALNISVDEACSVEFNADMFLEGGPYACYDDYIVSIIPFGNPNLELVVTGPLDFSNALGTHEYSVLDPATGNSCWGEFTVEDKLGPMIDCSNFTVTCIDPIPFGPNPGADLTAPISLVMGEMPAQDAVTVYTTNVPFDVVITDLDVVVDFVYSMPNTADMTITITSPAGTSTDLWNAISGCGGAVNMIADDEGANALTCANFNTGINADYAGSVAALGIIVDPLSVFDGESTFGDWTITITETVSAGGFPDAGQATINNIAILINGGFILPATMPTDNCGAVTVASADVVTPGNCETGIDRIINRTFLVTDQNGMTAQCTQTITVTNIESDDITPPVTPVILPCGTGVSPEEIVAYFDNKVDTDGDGFPDTPINPTNDIPLGPNCSLNVIEKNEGIVFGYFNYPATGCDGNVYPQPVNNNVCNLYSSYTDQEIPACAPGCSGNVKVIRTWTILDWCNPSQAPLTFIQIIKSVDTDAPTIEVANDYTVSVNPWNCSGDFSLPAPTLLHDLCTADLTYSVNGPAGVTVLAPNTPANPSNFWVAFGAKKGANLFTYTASDCCGNTASAVLTVNVFDTTPPVPVATQNIVVNLTTDGSTGSDGNAVGVAKIFNTSVDNGSYDGCSGVKIEIRRDDRACGYSGNGTFNADGHPQDGSTNPTASNFDPDNGTYVKFCCEDIDQVDPVSGVAYGIVKVTMRVFDDGNMTGFYGDFVDLNGDGDVLDAGEYDNYNETWVDVRVEGKSIPSLVCPPDVTLACDMDYTDASMIGSASTFNLCGNETVNVTFTPNLNACHTGFVIATYSIEGNAAVSCNQRITINNPYPAFDPATIRYPNNLPTSPTGQLACDDDITYAAPTWTAGACDFIGYTEDVDTFFFEVDPATGIPSDACFKILRQFTVIDWCVYDATNGQQGLYFGSQTIKITDREAPVLNNCNPAMFEVDANCVRTSTTLTNSATDNGDCASDWLKWQILVDTWADNVIDYEYSSFLPTNDSNLNNDTNGNGINDRYVAPTMSGEDVSITVLEEIESSMFNHRVIWKVTDGCGNVASCETTFMVVDKKAPTPYCVNISSAPMGVGGSVELWAIDFDLGAFDNCTAQENLRFTFSSTLPENDNTYDPAQRSSAKTFSTCGTQVVAVYVFDEKGNFDFCNVNLTLAGVGCDGNRPVAGTTATELGNGVSNAMVTLEAPIAEYPRTNATDANGAFAFTENPEAVDYALTVVKNDDHTNGVSTLDLVLIQRHILDLAVLDSPYKVIAADINRDDKVSSVDIVELRKVVLGVQDEFNNNTSWRFVDSAQQFADNLDPFPVDETRNINNLSANMVNENFVAVKVGDVNATASSNVAGVESEVRSGSTMVMEIAERAVVAGEQVEIAVSSADFKAVSGYQMTLEFNGLTFTGVAGKAINVAANNVAVISDNVVTMSWNASTAVTSTDDLFVITAIAERAGNISSMIKVTDRVITPEVYVGSNLEIHNVELGIRTDNGIVAATNQLMQNEPNPFKESTTISFNLVESGAATLTVMDVTGKVVRVVNGEYPAGLNTITLAKDELNAVGVLYYTLESGDFNETKKMIIIE